MALSAEIIKIWAGVAQHVRMGRQTVTTAIFFAYYRGSYPGRPCQFRKGAPSQICFCFFSMQLRDRERPLSLSHRRPDFIGVFYAGDSLTIPLPAECPNEIAVKGATKADFASVGFPSYGVTMSLRFL
jgi:hypothetical protein